MHVDHRACSSENSDILTRHNHASEADRGENSFAERAEVDHTSVAVKSLERSERTAGVAKLAVVIVFEYQGILLLGPLDQFKPTRQAHRHAKRILMRGRHI